MLKKIWIIVFATFITVSAHCQTMEEIFEPKAALTWLGLDFTGAKLIGDREQWGGKTDIKNLMRSWNELMRKEPDKFDIGLAIDKLRVQEDFSITMDHNEELDPTDMISANEADYFHFRPNDILRIVAGYDFKGKKGLGVMFIVESFNKPKEEGSAWVTFVDMERKDVFFSKRVTGDAGGFGLRNHWGNSIYNMMKSMRKKEFEMWRKKYYRKS